MVAANTVFHEKKPKLVFKSEGGEKEPIEEMIFDGFLSEEDFSPRISKPRSRYCTWTILIFYFLLMLFLMTTIFFSLHQKRAEKLKFYESHQQFRDYNVRFGKKHENSSDLQMRFQVFTENLKRIRALEMEHSGVKFSINQFTDRTDDEMRKMLMDKKFMVDIENSSLNTTVALSPAPNRPDYKDWRNEGKVMSVKNQGPCGSCWAFATVSSVESQYAIRKGTLWSLSEQELVDCDGESYGCNGGFMDKALGWILGNGLETEDDYPYEAVRHDQCYINSEKTRVWVDEGYRLANNEDFIADWVDQVGPVSFAMRLPKSFYSYANGVYHPSEAECNDPNNGYHAMTIIGYGNEEGQDYWIVKNSWGTSWGDQGYMRLARGQNVCGAGEYVVGPKIN